MLIKLNQIKHLLNNRSISAYSIEQVLDLSRQTISKLRNGSMELEDIKLSSAIKLQEYINTHYKISVDYEQLINEFKQDYNDLNDYILVEFDYGKELEIDIIIDYLNVEDFNPKQNNLRLEYMHKDKLLNLLEEINKID